MEKTFYHSEIIITTLAKNGSERLGAIASCTWWTDNPKRPIDLTMYGKTKQEAKDKLIAFLSSNGKYKTEYVIT